MQIISLKAFMKNYDDDDDDDEIMYAASLSVVLTVTGDIKTCPLSLAPQMSLLPTTHFTPQYNRLPVVLLLFLLRIIVVIITATFTYRCIMLTTSSKVIN